MQGEPKQKGNNTVSAGQSFLSILLPLLVFTAVAVKIVYLSGGAGVKPVAAYLMVIASAATLVMAYAFKCGERRIGCTAGFLGSVFMIIAVPVFVGSAILVAPLLTVAAHEATNYPVVLGLDQAGAAALGDLILAAAVLSIAIVLVMFLTAFRMHKLAASGARVALDTGALFIPVFGLFLAVAGSILYYAVMQLAVDENGLLVVPPGYLESSMEIIDQASLVPAPLRILVAAMQASLLAFGAIIVLYIMASLQKKAGEDSG